MGSRVVNGVIIIAVIAAFVILTLRGANIDRYVTFIMMLGPAIGLVFNNSKTKEVSEKLETVEHNTNGSMTTLTHTLETDLPALKNQVKELNERIDRLT